MARHGTSPDRTIGYAVLLRVKHYRKGTRLSDIFESYVEGNTPNQAMVNAKAEQVRQLTLPDTIYAHIIGSAVTVTKPTTKP